MKQSLLVCLVGLALSIGLLVTRPVKAETVEDIFARGVKSFNAGEYEESARVFGSLVERFKVKSPDVLVNLGAAEFGAGRPGLALLHFHRAMQAAPGTTAADTALVNAERLRAALNRSQGEHPQKDGFVFGRYHDAWIAILGWLAPLPAATVFLVFWTILFVSLGMLRLRGRASRSLRWIAVAASIATVISGIAAFGAAHVASYRVGVVMDRAGLFNEVASAEPIMTLPEGLEVRVLGDRGGFMQVRLSSGREGFVSDRAIGLP